MPRRHRCIDRHGAARSPRRVDQRREHERHLDRRPRRSLQPFSRQYPINLEVHHLIHWIKGGPTDTFNLAALCPENHRGTHVGAYTAIGNADLQDGTFWRQRNGAIIPAAGTRSHQPARYPNPYRTCLPPPLRRNVPHQILATRQFTRTTTTPRHRSCHQRKRLGHVPPLSWHLTGKATHDIAGSREQERQRCPPTV